MMLIRLQWIPAKTVTLMSSKDLILMGSTKIQSTVRSLPGNLL